MNDDTTLDFSVVRELRKQAGMTLGEVSANTGISIAGLSKLERNQTIIELDTLYRLARVFGLSATDLLALAESCSAHRKRATKYRSGPFLFEKVGYKGLDLFRARGRTGESLSKPEAHGDEFEICWVLEGSVRITLPKEQHTLETGDALKFDAVLGHNYEVLRDSELVIAHVSKAHRF